MASFTGITAARADEILGESVVSGSINGEGHLILVRENGSTIDAGDFTAIVTDILTDQVNAAVEPAVNEAVTGPFYPLGEVSGALGDVVAPAGNLVNALFTLTLVGNATFDAANLPSGSAPGTQFAMRIVQDSVGSRTLTTTGFLKSQGVLTLSTGANAIDMLIFMYDGVAWYAGMMGIDFR